MWFLDCYSCYFCHVATCLGSVVDIGGLKLCLDCYRYRSNRTSLPCEVCGVETRITPNPLMTSTICGGCDVKTDLRKAYEDAGWIWDSKNNKRGSPRPCYRCGGTHEYHHATVYGQNLCHVCYEKAGRPCTQVYCGDRGYPAFACKPSKPAVILPLSGLHESNLVCKVCNKSIGDPNQLLSEFGLPAICSQCDGPPWWNAMHKGDGA